MIAIVPNDQDAQKKYKTCEKDIRLEAFQKAIEADTPVSELVVDVDSINVEDSYTGPRLVWPTSSPIDMSTSPSSAVNMETSSFLTIEFVKEVMQHFRDEKLLHRKYVLQILVKAIEHFKKQQTLLRLTLPRETTITSGTAPSSSGNVCGAFTVCGDTHGQYYDLCNIFALNGDPSPQNAYLFNGDFVDRGSFSFETVFTLLCWKLALPNSLFMLRGNHETK